jgi:hypothetical protein
MDLLIKRFASSRLYSLIPGGLVTITLALTGIASSAQAENYRNASGNTVLRFNEDNSTTGLYQTKIGGKNWYGQFSATATGSPKDLTRTYTGTFEDSPEILRQGRSPNTPLCKGKFTAVRQFDANQALWKLQVTWKVEDGTQCPAVGTTFTMAMQEPIPINDAQGEWTQANTTTYWNGFDAGQNNYKTWDYWLIVDPTGKLNCREKPNGKVVFTYRAGERFIASSDGRGYASAIMGDHPDDRFASLGMKGRGWMRTSKTCFVRASTSQIRPLSASKK